MAKAAYFKDRDKTKEHRLKTVLLCVMHLSPIFFFSSLSYVDAVPLNSFALSPIPYWDDDSVDVSTVWDSTDQTVDISYSQLNESGWFENFSEISEWSDIGNSLMTTDGSQANLSCDGGTYGIQATATNEFSITTQMYLEISCTELDNSGDYAVYAYGDGSWREILSYYSSTGTQKVLMPSAYLPYSGIRIYIKPLTGWVILNDLRIYPETGDLDIGVPINRQDTQSIELYMNTTTLNSEVQIGFFNDATTNNVYCSVNSTHVNFPSDGYLGRTYIETSGLTTLVFIMTNEQKTGTILVADDDDYILDSWEDEYTLTGNNLLRFTNPAFNGSFILYYLNGDTNYTLVRNTPEWTKTGTQDPDVTQHQQGMYVEQNNQEIDHDITYSVDLPYLGYLSTEFFFGQDMDGAIGAYSWGRNV